MSDNKDYAKKSPSPTKEGIHLIWHIFGPGARGALENSQEGPWGRGLLVIGTLGGLDQDLAFGGPQASTMATIPARIPWGRESQTEIRRESSGEIGGFILEGAVARGCKATAPFSPPPASKVLFFPGFLGGFESRPLRFFSFCRCVHFLFEFMWTRELWVPVVSHVKGLQ